MCTIIEQVSLPSQFDKQPELPDLLNTVAAKAKANNWEQIAIQLKLSDVDSIREARSDTMSRYTEVFKVWRRRGSPPYTWATMINVLRTPAVNEVRLASEVMEWVQRRSQWETYFD